MQETSTSILDVAGDALSAASADEHAGARIARLAVIVSGAEAAFVWRSVPDGIAQAGSHGAAAPPSSLAPLAQRILHEHGAISVESLEDAGTVVTLQLGQPPLGAMQLVFPADAAPEADELGRLTSFAVRAAHALRSSERARTLGFELERSRALLELVSEAISRLSLSHTVETTLERLAELLGADRVAVYLDEDGRLSTAASRALEGPHEPVAQRAARARARAVAQPWDRGGRRRPATAAWPRCTTRRPPPSCAR